MRPNFETLVAFAVVSLLACREAPTAPAEGNTDFDVCGQAPSLCSQRPLDGASCGEQCGEFYDCQCDREEGRWGVTIWDCWCEACNPVSQSGCREHEKCGQLVESDAPFLARTTCLPEGTVAEGGACTDGAAGAATGFDDCVGGYDCVNGICVEICSVGPPDGCRSDSEAFGEGSYCIAHVDGFGGDFGVCERGCHPLDDAVLDGAVTNASCGAGQGCYVDVPRGIAHCTETSPGADEKTQGFACDGPESGGCYPNGCAPGFAPLLNAQPSDAEGTLCARYCSPSESHSTAQDSLAGANGRCLPSALAATGTNGDEGEYQCRFVQSFYEAASAADESLGMCVPVNPIAGGTWSDCRDFDWDAIKAVWNDAIAAEMDPQLAFNNFCLVNPSDPDNSEFNNHCVGLSRGCISLSERAAGLAPTR